VRRDTDVAGDPPVEASPYLCTGFAPTHGASIDRVLRVADSVRIADSRGLRPDRDDGDVTIHRPAVHGGSRFRAMVQPGTVIWKRP